MGRDTNTATVEPGKKVIRRPRKAESRPKPRRQPRYHVILWDDDDHTYEYVMRMMQELFHYESEQSFLLACEVDTCGRAVCMTTPLELAELKRDQILAFGKDSYIGRCQGSMTATIEPER